MLQTLKHNCFKIVPLEDCIDLKTPFREGKLMRIDTQLRFRKLKGGGGKFKHAKKKHSIRQTLGESYNVSLNLK